MLTDYLKNISENLNLEITPLRKAIIQILYRAKKPIGAYDVLEELKKTRPNAKPPTVYRVLDFLKNENVIHKIDSNNTYTCCSVDEICANSILLVCSTCKKTQEVSSAVILKKLESLSKDNHFIMAHSPVEVSGLCAKCISY